MSADSEVRKVNRLSALKVLRVVTERTALTGSRLLVLRDRKVIRGNQSVVNPDLRGLLERLLLARQEPQDAMERTGLGELGGNAVNRLWGLLAAMA